MDIRGPGGVSGPNRLEAHSVPVKKNDAASTVSSTGDRVEISDYARLLEKLSQVPAVRTERIEALKKEIEAGVYETPEKIDVAAERLLAEIEGREVW